MRVSRDSIRWLFRAPLLYCGYDIRRYVSERGASLPLLALAAESYLQHRPDFFFVQVGANDGLRADPLHSLVRQHRLRGLLIEPLPDVFQELCANYADQPQLLFENSALGDEDGNRDFFRVRRGVYSNPLVMGMAGFDRDALLSASRYLPGLRHNIEKTRVRTSTVATIFRKHSLSRFDLLVVDTEGFDDRVIQLVLTAGFAPPIIFFEHWHLSAARQDACCETLRSKGYQFARTRTDTLAMVV